MALHTLLPTDHAVQAEKKPHTNVRVNKLYFKARPVVLEMSMLVEPTHAVLALPRPEGIVSPLCPLEISKHSIRFICHW